MPDAENKVQYVYASTNNQELEERYDQWASEYDRDLEEDFAWNAPQTAADVFAKLTPKSAKVLDAGAGTGLAGEALAALGFTNLVAMDLSQGMLEEARNKNIYAELHQMVMGETLDFSSDSFDGVISVGVFTLGHAPASAFDELIRVTKPGGHVVFSLRTDMYEGAGFKEKQSELEAQGKWKLAEASDPYQPLPKGEPEVFHQIWAYRV
ncbi:MAG: SAM-dependent methyltransferase [SAR202 cluster bacterium Io17-Chloro-G7]|nr:MAG: SAM-dependent methyltransferase [SAR202 cluster bacterium Io17-Chloro-G7]